MEKSANMAQCFKSGKCVNCVLAECSLLKDLVFHDFIAEGVQGSVVSATYKKKHVAVKIELLNAYPVTMTKRTKMKCDSFWFKIPLLANLIATILTLTNSNPIYNPITTSQFHEELKMATRMGDLKVGPIVYDGGVCLKNIQTKAGTFDVGLIIMEKYDMTLAAFVEKKLNSIVDRDSFRKSVPIWRKLVRNLLKMTQKNIGISHGDLHDNNILVKESGRRLKVAIIDFGLTHGNSPGLFRSEIEFIIYMLEEDIAKHAHNLGIPMTEFMSYKWV